VMVIMKTACDADVQRCSFTHQRTLLVEGLSDTLEVDPDEP
jgi:hypothetical protein